MRLSRSVDLAVAASASARPASGTTGPGAAVEGPSTGAGDTVPLGRDGGAGGAGAERLKDQSGASGIVTRLRACGNGAVQTSCYLVAVRISRDDVLRVAHLARLDLDDDEVETFTAQLGDILEHAARVDALDTSAVEPTAHPVPLANVLRRDERGPTLDRDAVLAQAPAVESGYFRVPRILDPGA